MDDKIRLLLMGLRSDCAAFARIVEANNLRAAQDQATQALREATATLHKMDTELRALYRTRKAATPQTAPEEPEPPRQNDGLDDLRRVWRQYMRTDRHADPG